MADTETHAATDQALLCVVCHGEASGLAVVDRFGSITYRVCDDPRCCDTAKRWAAVGGAAHDFTPYEREAMANAGRIAGKRLAAGGVTDMAKLSKEQWQGHINAVVLTYRSELQRIVADNYPPF